MTTDFTLCATEGCKNKRNENIYLRFGLRQCVPCVDRLNDGLQTSARAERAKKRGEVLGVLFLIGMAAVALWGFVAVIKFCWIHS